MGKGRGLKVRGREGRKGVLGLRFLPVSSNPYPS